MKTKGFYKQDWFIALIIGLVFSLSIVSGTQFLERLEFIAYDAGVKFTHRTPGATDQIAIVAIDDESIKQIGRWPWPRSVLASMLDKLTQAEARAVGLLVYLTEPQTDPGLVYIRSIREKVDRLGGLGEVKALLSDAEKNLDTDGKLAQTIPNARPVHFPMIPSFPIGNAAFGRPDGKLPEYVGRNKITKVVARGEDDDVLRASGLQPPLAAFGEHAASIGPINFDVNSDNGVRSVFTLLEYNGEYYPSLPILLAAGSLNLGPADIEVNLGKGLKIGRLSIPTDSSMRMYTGFYAKQSNEENAFATYSFHDVQNDALKPGALKNKIVLIGPTASGIGTRYATPVMTDQLMTESELTANVIASILNQDFYISPTWVRWLEAGVILVIVLYLMFAMPRLDAKTAGAVSLLLLVALLGAEQFLMVSERVWFRGVSPALLLFVGHVAITSKRFFLTERLKIAAETDSAYSNRMLGLAFQAQGQLDMAMDKFRKLPANEDESVLELFYNLALDFERKRQFHKAMAAYDHILEHNPKFRDVAERKKRANQADQTIILGSRGATAGGTMILDGGDTKPTLGRYLVEKELGRGAMGTVYLGRDPKINRMVAIKTMALTQEFEEKELAEVRERFFREAETAGRLHHPNIVTIYDAGEEHDLAYIAMEFLQGKDLSNFIHPDKKLPWDWIYDISIKVADALNFAHQNDVVHRDIKPANIVYHEADKSVKVTDFGIARITATSKTKTGVILGTPSYMSPEQLAGKHVDGRSDLFSFGAMLYEMVSGRTPFGGDSLATLMFQIANEPTPNVRVLRPDTPDALIEIINRLLEKNPDKRYATGEAVKKDLEQCRNELKNPAGA